MIDISAIKNKVLDLAFQGKLVSNSEMEINTNNNIIRKQYDFFNSEHSSFAWPLLSTNWQWLKFSEVFDVVSAKRIKKDDWRNKGVPFYRAREIKSLNLNEEIINGLFIDESKYAEVKNYNSPQSGDIMLTAVGTIGIPYIVTAEDTFYYKDASVLCLKAKKKVDSVFYKYYIETPFFKKLIHTFSNGTTVDTLTINALSSYPLPLPPLEEQKRIVTKIEELFAKIDEIDKAQKELKELAELAEKKVLDMAVRGELSSSLSSDSKAEDLLKQNNVNKSVLIAQKKLRNEKELPYVSELEKYIELPPHWVWTRLGSISYGLNYGTSNKSKSCGKVAVLRMGNLQNGEIDYSDLVFTENEEDIEKYQLLQNDLLFNRTNSAKHVGKTAIYRGEVPAIFAGYLIRIRTDMNQDYLNIVMNSSYEKNYCQSVKTDAVNQSNVNAQKLASFPIPVPPIEEQSRIATTVSLFRAQFSTINS